jgi:hypothetical protein
VSSWLIKGSDADGKHRQVIRQVRKIVSAYDDLSCVSKKVRNGAQDMRSIVPKLTKFSEAHVYVDIRAGGEAFHNS